MLYFNDIYQRYKEMCVCVCVFPPGSTWGSCWFVPSSIWPSSDRGSMSFLPSRSCCTKYTLIEKWKNCWNTQQTNSTCGLSFIVCQHEESQRHNSSIGLHATDRLSASDIDSARKKKRRRASLNFRSIFHFKDDPILLFPANFLIYMPAILLIKRWII